MFDTIISYDDLEKENLALQRQVLKLRAENEKLHRELMEAISNWIVAQDLAAHRQFLLILAQGIPDNQVEAVQTENNHASK